MTYKTIRKFSTSEPLVDEAGAGARHTSFEKFRTNETLLLAEGNGEVRRGKTGRTIRGDSRLKEN